MAFTHFGNDGVDYLKIYIKCPVCLEHGWPTEASYWYHDTDDYGNYCGGEMYLGDNGYYRCAKCGHTSPALIWKYCCPNHEQYGHDKYLSITDTKYIAGALSITGQLMLGDNDAGTEWLIKVSNALLKYEKENPYWNKNKY